MTEQTQFDPAKFTPQACEEAFRRLISRKRAEVIKGYEYIDAGPGDFLFCVRKESSGKFSLHVENSPRGQNVKDSIGRFMAGGTFPAEFEVKDLAMALYASAKEIDQQHISKCADILTVQEKIGLSKGRSAA